MRTVLERIRKLEEAQKATVDSTLAQIRHLVSAEGLAFNMVYLVDLLLTLKMVARESKHPKAGYFTAVLEAMRNKLSVSDDQFKKYTVVLLGDMDHERVLDAMSKVDKAERNAYVKPRGGGGAGSKKGANRERFANVKCFSCSGNYKSHSPENSRSNERSSKKAKCSLDFDIAWVEG